MQTLRAASDPVFWSRAQARADNQSGAPSLCTLVNILRLMIVCGQKQDAERLAVIVLNTALRYVGRAVSSTPWLSPQRRQDIKDDAHSEVLLHVMSLCPEDEFWEANAQHALTCLTLGLTRSTIRSDDKIVRTGEADGDDRDWLANIADTCALSVEDQAILRIILEHLPAELYAAMALKTEGLTEAEVGIVLGVTDRTVRNYLRRARQFLEEWIKEPTVP